MIEIKKTKQKNKYLDFLQYIFRNNLCIFKFDGKLRLMYVKKSQRKYWGKKYLIRVLSLKEIWDYKINKIKPKELR